MTESAIDSFAANSGVDGKFDSLLVRSYAGQFCNYLHGSQERSFGAYNQGHFGSSEAAQRSARVLDDARRRFCDRGVDVTNETAHDYVHVALIAAAAAGDQSAKRLLDINLDDVSEMNTDQVAVVATDLEQLLKETESPGTFMQAAELLKADEFADWLPEGFDAAGARGDDLAAARQYGPELAACNTFAVCHATSVLTLRACLPNRCAPGSDLGDYIRRELTESQFELAKRYAAAITAARRH